MEEIAITDVEANGGRVEYEYDHSPSLRRFFGQNLAIEYDVDVSEVPESILVIPCLANLCPVAWATGADVSVPTVDSRLLDALESARGGFEELYPEFATGSTVRADRRVDNSGFTETSTSESTGKPASDSTEASAATEGGHAILFSGGVDSMASYVRHREEHPLLVSIHGFDIELDDRTAWAKRAPELREFGEARDLTNRFVRMNLHSALDVFSLNARFGEHYADDWITSVGYGLSLLGTCAPLSAVEDVETLHIAASGWNGCEPPGGSHHEIVDEVAWADTTVEHDVYDLTRQERIDRIAEYVREESADLEIRSCSREGDNCSRCLKCMRTAVGLLLAGLDPDEHGYEFDRETFGYIRRRLETEDWRLSDYERLMWRDMQERIDSGNGYPYPEAEAFFAWLRTQNVENLGADPADSNRNRVLYGAARRTPYPVYSSLRSTYRFVDEWVLG
jgi:hypothetical protein